MAKRVPESSHRSPHLKRESVSGYGISLWPGNLRVQLMTIEVSPSPLGPDRQRSQFYLHFLELHGGPWGESGPLKSQQKHMVGDNED